MLFKTATSLAFATACLTALATMPSQAQMAGTGGSAPAYSGQQPADSGQPLSNPGQQTFQGSMPANSAGIGGTDVVTNGPQGSPPANWSARRNVVESQHYDRLLETNRGFRQAR